MSEKLLVPDIGDFENVEVIEILVKPGDQIKENDPIVTIESDKSSVEIPSTIAGKVDSLAVKVGDKVSKGDLILTLSSNEKKINETIPPVTEKIITKLFYYSDITIQFFKQTYIKISQFIITNLV